MSDYFVATGTPVSGAALQSAPIDAEFAAIETAMNKLPTITGNANKTIKVNAGATALTVSKVLITEPATSATLTIDDGFTLHATGNVTALSGSSTGTNTGDQTNITGNAGTVTNGVYTTDKDATGGVPGLTLFKINFKNAANTFTSFFTNMNTAARTYTFQNRDGTIADDTDLAAKAALAGSAAQAFSVAAATAAAHATAWGQLRFGQCHLAKSGANLLLSPVGGNLLTINGLHYVIPSAGVTLAPPATDVTTYQIYAYMNSGTMTLEASATAYAIDATTGVPIKTGDATRTLVGLARTVSSAWVDTARQRLVLSYWNRKLRTASNYLASTTATTSSTPVEIFASTDRVEFLCFADDIEIKHNVSIQIGAGGSIAPSSWTSLDGSTTTGDSQTQTITTASIAHSMGQSRGLTTTEGFHYASLFGQSVGGVSTSFTSTYCAVGVSFFG